MKYVLLIAALSFLFLLNSCDNKEKLIVDHYEKGMDLAVQGNFNKAKTEFESAFKMDTIRGYIESNIHIINDVDSMLLKKDAAVHLFKGIVYYEKAKYNVAIEEISKTIQINPEYAYAYNKRGIAKYLKRDYNDAIKDYNKAIELNPDLTIVYYNRALAYDESGQKSEALEQYRLFLLKVKPQDKYYMQYAQLRIEELKGLAF